MMTVDGRDDGWVMTMACIRFCAASQSSCFFSSEEVVLVVYSAMSTKITTQPPSRIYFALFFSWLSYKGGW